MERVRLKEWSEEREKKLQEEEAAVAPAQQTSSGASASRPTPALRKNSRKDSSQGTKVRTYQDHSLGARDPGTSGNILGTLKALDQFASDVSTRHSLITFGM